MLNLQKLRIKNYNDSLNSSSYAFSQDADCLYRFHEYQSMATGRVYIDLTRFKIIRRTPKGCWISDFSGKDRFILDNSLRGYAHATMEAALEAFRHRKLTQIRIVTNTLQRAQQAVEEIPKTLQHIKEYKIQKEAYLQNKIDEKFFKTVT